MAKQPGLLKHAERVFFLIKFLTRPARRNIFVAPLGLGIRVTLPPHLRAPRAGGSNESESLTEVGRFCFSSFFLVGF